MPYSFIVVNVKQTGFHSWRNAPEEVDFLEDLHRHTFHIRAKVLVGHTDRQVEFTLLKKEIEKYLKYTYTEIFDGLMFEGRSCEMLSLEMFEYLELKGYSVREVSFSEDGEFEGGVQCSKES